MKRTSLIVVIFVLISLPFAGLRFLPDARATTLYVGGMGPGNYTTIQEAIDGAFPGDTVYVYNGTYHENVFVNKTVSLIGQNRDATTIVGDSMREVVLVSADGATVSGFRVDKSGINWPDGGIELYDVVNCYVIDNNISDMWHGIHLEYADGNYIIGNIVHSNYVSGIAAEHSNGNVIKGNIAWFNLHGIYVSGDHNTVDGNTLLENDEEGVFFETSNHSTVSRNDFRSDGNGITLWNSTNVTIRDNTLTVNASITFEAHGIHLFQSDHVTIEGNHVSDMGEAVYLQNSAFVTVRRNELFFSQSEGIRSWICHNVTVVDNYIKDNGLGIRLFDSEYVIYHNSFINSAIQAVDDGDTSQWDDGYPSGGNYWSDYSGFDQKSGPGQDQPGSDGIGDTPYVIDADSVDRYPLMSPTPFPLQPPELLDATLTGTDYEDVVVTWSLSPDDGMGLDSVIAYDVFRGMTYASDGSGYGLVGSLPRGASSFVDGSVGEGNPNDYFYKVCAVDFSGNSSCSRNQGGKFTHPLSQGPNLVSIPLIQSNETVETVLQTVEYNKAWYYDSSSQEWKWHMTFKAYRRGLWTMNHTMGMWVNVTGDCNLTVAGIVPAQTTMQLYEGWNLVSFPSFNASYSVSDLKAGIGTTRVEGYDAIAPPDFLRVLGDAEALQAGRAYWVKVQADVEWAVSFG